MSEEDKQVKVNKSFHFHIKNEAAKRVSGHQNDNKISNIFP